MKIIEVPDKIYNKVLKQLESTDIDYIVNPDCTIGVDNIASEVVIINLIKTADTQRKNNE